MGVSNTLLPEHRLVRFDVDPPLTVSKLNVCLDPFNMPLLQCLDRLIDPLNGFVINAEQLVYGGIRAAGYDTENDGCPLPQGLPCIAVADGQYRMTM
jgi:hypothetical protein